MQIGEIHILTVKQHYKNVRFDVDFKAREHSNSMTLEDLVVKLREYDRQREAINVWSAGELIAVKASWIDSEAVNVWSEGELIATTEY